MEANNYKIEVRREGCSDELRTLYRLNAQS